MLTLKEKYKVTQTAIDFTVSQMKNAVDKMVDDLCSAVGEEVKKTQQKTLTITEPVIARKPPVCTPAAVLARDPSSIRHGSPV